MHRLHQEVADMIDKELKGKKMYVQTLNKKPRSESKSITAEVQWKYTREIKEKERKK